METNNVIMILGGCLVIAILAAPVWKICTKIFFRGGIKNKVKNTYIGGDFTGRDKK